MEKSGGQTEEVRDTAVTPGRDAPDKAHEIGDGEDEAFLVTFTEPTDLGNPKDWSKAQKWAVTGVLSATGFNRIMVSTIMAPALNSISKELNMSNTEAVMAMSAYLLATAFGPLVIGPLSEIYGRRPVLHVTNFWFLLWNIICGFARNKALLIISRLLAGFGAGAVYVLASGVLGDVWRPEQRGRSLSLYLLWPLLGAGVGPILGGIITQRTTWRWIFWSTSIFQAVLVTLSLPLFHETYAPVILKKRALRMRKETGDTRYCAATEKLNQGRTKAWIVGRGLSRPFRLFFLQPVVQIQAFLSSFCYGLTYLVLTTYAELWTSQYNQSTSASGLHYLALCLGEVIGALLGGPLMDCIYRRLKGQAKGSAKPEFHILIMFPGAALIVIGLLLYGWAAQARLFWLTVDIGGTILCLGMQICGMALQAYVIDTFPDHNSSAFASSQFFRSMTAFSFPLFAPKMYSVMDYGWANTMLALIAAVINVLVPGFVWRYGEKLRAKAKGSY